MSFRTWVAQLRDVLYSFARRDVVKAVDVWTRDQDVDRLYTSLFRELLLHMMENPVTVTFGIHLLFCTKNIERMGDHATNIAEAVYYMVNGESLLRERPRADVTSMLGGAVVLDTTAVMRSIVRKSEASLDGSPPSH